MAEAKQVEVRVLVDCAFGKPNQVVKVDAAAVKGLAGVVDADSDAVAYAKTLPQPKAAPDGE